MVKLDLVSAARLATIEDSTFLHEKLIPELWMAYRVTTSSIRLYSSLGFFSALRLEGTL